MQPPLPAVVPLGQRLQHEALAEVVQWSILTVFILLLVQVSFVLHLSLASALKAQAFLAGEHDLGFLKYSCLSPGAAAEQP